MSLQNATAWLNSEPLTKPALRGKVAVVNFWTYTCINWLRTLPYVRAWAGKYRKYGLVVIGVHTPEFRFERTIDHVRAALARTGIHYPVAIDNDYEVWRAFGNQYWPALYFIDAEGRIRHHQFGEGSYHQSEIVIQDLLRESGASIDAKAAPVEEREIEEPADWANLRSPENYLGAGRTQNFVSARDHSRYVTPGRLDLNQWALAGDWNIGAQSIVLKEAHGRIAYRFHARDLHLVMGPRARGDSIRFRVSLDGKAPSNAHGLDIDGNGYGTLMEPRLYQLIRQPKPINDVQFAIEFLDAGAEAFAFTFG